MSLLSFNFYWPYVTLHVYGPAGQVLLYFSTNTVTFELKYGQQQQWVVVVIPYTWTVDCSS
jgi:hypothetical protein